MRITLYVVKLLAMTSAGACVAGCGHATAPAAAAAAAEEARVVRSADTRPVRAASAESVVTRVYGDLAAGRGREHRDDLYDPSDELALEMLDGSPKLRDGTKRLRVSSAKELDDCAAVVAIASEDGSDIPFVTYLVQKDGAWKLILPAGNWGPGRYRWTDEQMNRLEQLRRWAYDAAGVN